MKAACDDEQDREMAVGTDRKAGLEPERSDAMTECV